MLDRVTVLSQTERKWVVTIQGALGTFVAAIADLPIEDISVEPFTLEDYVLRFYSGSRQ
jgi:hypothetical protein